MNCCIACAATTTAERSFGPQRFCWTERGRPPRRDEMNAKRREYGRPAAIDPVFRTELSGFSVLGKRDGELVCLIFFVKPERFDTTSTRRCSRTLALPERVSAIVGFER